VAVARDPAGDKEKMASRRRKPEGGAWPAVKHRAGGAWAAAVSRTSLCSGVEQDEVQSLGAWAAAARRMKG
jgi:hypothetical protein